LGEVQRFENAAVLLIAAAGILFALVRRALRWRARVLGR
jgi:hypothetical protein